MALNTWTLPVPMGLLLSQAGCSGGSLMFAPDTSPTDTIRIATEPYMPSRFARQFGYDQLYVGNPNPDLHHRGNLLEASRAWYYSIAGGTKAKFILPFREPNSYCSLSFASLYSQASYQPTYRINSMCLWEIKALYGTRKGTKKSRLKGMDEFLAVEGEDQSSKPADVEEEARLHLLVNT